MNKITCFTTAPLGLLLLVLIAWNLADTSTTLAQIPINTGNPTYQSYQSEYTTTVVYNPTGGLNYKLIADHVDFFANQKITLFIRPVATMFNENKVPTWTVKADKAKLIKDRMLLYLYGHVQVDNLTDASQLKRITTDKAMVNLVTQDVSSDEEVTLYGTDFNSTGMKMRGNLRNKTAELIENVKTSYEFQNSQRIP
ncbi:MAG: LPS export ABC transporter periplasmic protein LptC [Sodalis sp. (in: enterobacteria)]